MWSTWTGSIDVRNTAMCGAVLYRLLILACMAELACYGCERGRSEISSLLI